MTFGTLVAVVAACFAAWNILPSHRKREVGLRIRLPDRILAGVGFIGAVALVFIAEVDPQREVVLPFLPNEALHPGALSALLLIVVVVVLVLRITSWRLSPVDLKKFLDLVDELIWAKEYPTLFKLVERHLGALSRVSSRVNVLERLGEWMARPYKKWKLSLVAEEWSRRTSRRSYEEVLPSPPIRVRASMLLSALTARASRRGGRGEVARRNAHEVLRLVLTSRNFVKAVAEQRPYFGLSLLSLDVQEVYDFVDIYFLHLIETPGSALFFELRRNTNCSYTGEYQLQSSNRLLTFLLSDAHVAEKLSVWKPFGNFILSELDRRYRDRGSDQYNYSHSAWEEEGKWSDSLYISLFYFEVMVSIAMWQGVRWHMWLYYLPPAVEKILRNFQVSTSKSSRFEAPSPYEDFLREIFSIHRRWIQATRHLPVNHPAMEMPDVSALHDNGCIPKSSIISLCECAAHVSERCSSRELQLELLKIPLDLYLELRSEERSIPFAKALGSCLEEQCERRSFRSDILAAFQRVDRFSQGAEWLEELEGYLVVTLSDDT